MSSPLDNAINDKKKRLQQAHHQLQIKVAGGSGATVGPSGREDASMSLHDCDAGMSPLVEKFKRR